MPSARYTPSKALDAKAEMISFWESEQGERFADAFMATTRDTFRHRSLFPRGWTGATFADVESNRLFTGEVYMVTSEMMDVCEYASLTLPPEEGIIRRDLLPTDRGFLVFEEPRYVNDIHGTKIGVSAISWATTNEVIEGASYIHPLYGDIAITKPVPGVRFVLYTSKFDAYDEAWDYERVVEAGLHDGLTKPEWQRMYQHAQSIQPSLVLSHSLFMPTDMPWEPKDATDEELLARINASTSNSSWIDYLITVWTMMGQTLADTHEAEVDKGTRKRMMRAKIPGRVTVIALRRKSGRHSEQDREGMIEWHHRWVVRGHWRRQPYKDGTTQLIWINAFIKGPEGKPFKQTEKVYLLKR